jgi:hypothetical protein
MGNPEAIEIGEKRQGQQRPSAKHPLRPEFSACITIALGGHSRARQLLFSNSAFLVYSILCWLRWTAEPDSCKAPSEAAAAWLGLPPSTANFVQASLLSGWLTTATAQITTPLRV